MVDLTTDSIGTGIRLVPASNTTYTLFPDVIIESTNDAAITDIFGPTAVNVTFNINGTVRGEFFAFALANGSGHDITVGATGQLTGSNGLVLEGTPNSSVSNAGLIRATGTAVGVIGANASFTNEFSGTVLGEIEGVIVTGTNASFTNNGVIGSENVAAVVGGNGDFTNNGIMYGYNNGVQTESSGQTFINNGSIVAQSLNLSEAIQVIAGSTDTLYQNAGLLSSPTFAFRSDTTANETFWNIGPDAEIIGLVALGDGEDVFRNFSANDVTDGVSGGAGNDMLFGGAGVEVFFGDAGMDYLELGGGDDRADGGADNDVIFGLGGDDTLSGGADDDVVHGNTGNDFLFGDAGNDDLFGGANDDFLAGGLGNDQLYGSIGFDGLVGGGGNDELIGGPNTDSLFGGSGSDDFRMLGFFGDNDVILDFTQGDDTITVAVAGVNAFIDVLSAASNVNGDTLIDFGTNQSFLIEGLRPAELTAGDFVIL